MAKTKKISINAFDKIVKETYTPTTTVEWHGQEIVVKRTLSFKEMMEFVDSVTKTCFTISTNTYMPEVKDFAVKSNILEKYANFTLPNNIEHRYELIYSSDAIETVLNYVSHQQFNEIMASIDAKINNLAQSNIEAMNKQMNELYTAFANLQSQMEGMFAGVNPDNFNALISAFGNGGLDEEKLVDAYLAKTKVEPK